MGSNFDWTGLLNAGINLFAANRNASQNQSAAQSYANAVRFNPYNISAGNTGVLFNGNNAISSLSPAYKNLQSQLTTGAGGLLGNIGNLYSGGGISPFLQSNFDTFNQQTSPYSTDIGDKFNATSRGFLGGLGSFDPNQAAADYTQNLRNQAAPGNATAAQDLAQGLFNGGRLGTTGGSNLYGQLIQAQNQQDLGFQLAGRQYAGQEQSRLAGLAQGFGQAGTQIGMAQNQMTNARAQQRFANAMQLFGAGQNNIQNQLSGGLSLLSGSQALDQGLLDAIKTGGYLGGASSTAAATGNQPLLQSQVAGNNANSAGLLGLLDSTGLLDKAGNWIGGLFGGGASGGNGDVLTQLGGQNPGSAQWWGVPEKQYGGGNFSGAGGQAAGLFGNSNLGLRDLGSVFSDSIQGMSDQQLASYLGSDPRIFDSGTFDAGGLLSGAQGALGIYSGLQQGGWQGYANAAQGAGQIAQAAGYGGALGNAVPILGAATGAYGTLKNIQAGNTGGAVASGAATGAAVGSIVPGLGTAVGAVIGGIVGGIGALIHGKDYKEEKVSDKYYEAIGHGMTWENSQAFGLSPEGFYQAFAGEFRRSHSKYPPRAAGYGQKDEGRFINDMKGKIQEAYSNGTIQQGADAPTILSKVVEPWFNTMGGWGKDSRYPSMENDEKQMTLDLINRYITGSPVDWAVIKGGNNSSNVVNSIKKMPRYA